VNAVQRLIDRVLNDEHPVPFDYEPANLDLVEPDAYDESMPDEGDDLSGARPE
jgi:hypothetical protein